MRAAFGCPVIFEVPMPKANPLPADWPSLLAGSDREEQLELLPFMERFAVQDERASVALLPLAVSADFALRLRTLLALGRLGQAKAFTPLVEILKQETRNHWRLALLDTLHMLPCSDKIGPLLPLLAQDQPGDGDAYFLRGLTWLLGQQGPTAIAPLCEWVLAQPARARRLKDGLLAEAIFLAARGDQGLLATLSKDNPPLYRFCSNRVWPKSTQPHYGIYPNPDYLLQKALQAGLSQNQFKSLYYLQRSKDKAYKR